MSPSNGDLLWWVSRGSGLAALVALSLGLALGVATTPGVGRPSFPIAGLHRAASLAGLGLTIAHVAAVVVDGYAPVGWLDAVLPFASPYRRVWTGLGTIAFDLMVVAALTSWRRLQPAYPIWKMIHALSWACWPIAVAHGLATGTDTRAAWALLLTLLCVAAVCGGFGWRVSGRRLVAWPAAIAGVLATVILTAAGPAAADWASRAGTPPGLGGVGATSAASWRASLLPRLSGGGLSVSGKLDERREPGGRQRAREVLTATLPGGSLTLVLEGPAYETGLNLESSAVSLGPTSSPHIYAGEVTSVNGSTYQATVGGLTSTPWRLMIEVRQTGPLTWSGLLSSG